VGKKGKVIGVDMTPEMVEKAKENAKKTTMKMWSSGSEISKSFR